MSLATSLQERFFRWALRGRPPEPVPIILTQRRVFVLPTRQGLAFTVALLAMLIGAINYNLSLGYALVFLLAGLGTIAILHTFRNLAHLQIMPGRTEPVFAGNPASFGLRLINLRNTARPAIYLNLPDQAGISIDIPPDTSIEARLDLPSTQRGWLSLPRVRLSTTYPLGLIRTWSYAAPDLRCLIYPAPASNAPAIPTTAGESGGTTHSVTGMEDFAGLRSQHPADPLRHVAWKAVARQDTGPLLTKQFNGVAAESLWLDWGTLSTTVDTETKLSILTRWTCESHAAGLVWGLRLPNGEYGPAAGDAHYRECLKQLALYAPN